MRLSFLLLACGLVLTSVSAQDSHFWASTSQVFGSGEIRVYDGAANLVTSFALPFGSVTRIAKGRSNAIWVADTTTSALVRYTLASGAGSSLPIAPISGVAVARGGQPWTFGGGLFAGPVVVRRHNTDGTPQFAVNAALSAARDLIVTRDGFGWLAGLTTPPSVERFSTTGVSSGVIPLAATGTPRSIKGDLSNNVWLLTQPVGGIAELTRVSSGLVQTLNVQVPGALAFVIDALGRPRVLADIVGGQEVRTLDAATGVAIGSFPVTGAAPYDGFVVDPNGNHWLTSTSGARLSLFDRWGTFVTTVFPGSAVGAGDTGDSTGLHLAQLCDTLDIDSDGTNCLTEMKRGSDPFATANEPVAFSFAPTPISSLLTTLSVDAPQFPGLTFVTAASFTTADIPVAIENPLSFTMAIDPLLLFWTDPMLNFFVFIPGTTINSIGGILDGSGHGELDFVIPPGTGGFSFFMAAAVFDGSGRIQGFSSAVPFAIL